ncbi:MAG: hypothetical protein ABI333_30735 [bacterium]
MSCCVSRYLMVGLAAFLTVGFGCGPKETNAPERRAEPESRRPNGPEQKLMPIKLRPRVDAVFTTQRGELERCYNSYVARTGKTKLRGMIIIAVRIGVTQEPLKVWFLKNTFQEPDLNRCFLKKVRAWLFPTWGGWQDYSFPKLILEEL